MRWGPLEVFFVIIVIKAVVVFCMFVFCFCFPVQYAKFWCILKVHTLFL